jgi:hypothetical protein
LVKTKHQKGNTKKNLKEEKSKKQFHIMVCVRHLLGVCGFHDIFLKLLEKKEKISINRK